MTGYKYKFDTQMDYENFKVNFNLVIVPENKLIPELLSAAS